MGENDKANQGTPQTTGQPSGSQDGSTSQSPKTFTEEEIQKKLSDALAEQGRKHKAELSVITKERDGFKTQLEAKDSEIKAVTDERAKLQADLEELASGDPKKFDILKRDKELRDEQARLRKEKTAIEAEKQSAIEEVNLAKETLLEISVFNIAAEYPDGDPVKLKTLCQKSKATTEEAIRDIADTVWTKETEEGGKPQAPKPYSGKSGGGSPYFTRAQIADRAFWTANKDEIEKAAKEGRIRD